MSLEKDISQIKKLVEDDSVFKAAGPDEVSKRPKHYVDALKETVDTLIGRLNWLKHDLDRGVITLDVDVQSAAKKVHLYLKSAEHELDESGL